MTDPDLGPRSSSDNAFKARARLHQSRFRLEVLGHRAYRDYGSRLATDAALAGENFFHRWPDVLDAVEKRFGVADKKLCWDMLASDHIPSTSSCPALDKLRTPKLKQLWRNQLLGEAMLQRRVIDAFTSVLNYTGLLQPQVSGSRFVAVTFEEHFARCRRVCDTAEAASWLDYLERRYVVA